MPDDTDTPKFRGERLSVYASEPMAAVLAGFEDNRSARLNQVCGRYRAMLDDAKPALTRDEWMACFDALNGIGLGEHVRFAWAEVSEACRQNGLGDKWNIDEAALVETLRGLSLAGCYALAESVDAWWEQTSNEQDPDRCMARVGIVPIDPRATPAGA